MLANYFQVREWLESFIPLVYGKKELGLARIRYLLKLLGNPQNKFKSIHVAGTSGKGSTAFYISRILSQIRKSEDQNTQKVRMSGKSDSLKFRSSESSEFSGKLKIGLHLSPHLVDIRERMQINGRLVPMDRFIKLMSEIVPVVESMKASTVGLPSYFEILVAASFLYFAQEKVDWAVVEVGLGGRLDATNVIRPEVSVITNVGLDHTDILGKTIEKIAFEKAGIIKKKVPVVTGAHSTSSRSKTSGLALGVIADVARKRQAPLITIDTQDKQLANKLLAIEAVNLALSGEIQSRKGAFLPSRMTPFRDFLTRKHLALQEATLSKTFSGRLEEIEEGVILDGAHNPDKIKFLIKNLSIKYYVSSIKDRIVLVVAFKKGKDWRKMVDFLIKNLPIREVIATQFYATTDMGPTPSQRLRGASKYQAVEPSEIRDFVISNFHFAKANETFPISNVKCIDNSQEAVFEAMQSVDCGLATTVLVTGSLYLVGEVRTMWKLPSFA